MLNHLVKHLNTQMHAETKSQASNHLSFRVLGRLYSLILRGTLYNVYRTTVQLDELV